MPPTPDAFLIDHEAWERLPAATRAFFGDSHHDHVHVARPEPTYLPTPRGAWRVHACHLDLPSVLGMSITGFAAARNYRARGWWGRNRLRLFLIEDPVGERALLIAGDIHVGSRWIAEQLGVALSPVGLPIERILLCAIHTHSGPGHFYGSDFYDWMAGEGVNEPGGLDEDFWNPICEALIGRVQALVTELEAPEFPTGRVGYGTAILEGVAWNRSAEAFLANHLSIPPLVAPHPEHHEKEIRAWCKATTDTAAADAGITAVNGVPPADFRDWGHGARWVDRKVRCLWFARNDGVDVGGVAFVGMTPTFIGGDTSIYSGDILGIGGRMAERRLGATFGCAGGTHGDVTAIDHQRDYEDFRTQRMDAGKSWSDENSEGTRKELRAAVRTARLLSDTLVKAANAAKADAAGGGRVGPADRLGVVFAEPDIAEAPWKEVADWKNARPLQPGEALPERLADRHRVGIGMMAASELDRTNEAGEGVLSRFVPGDPHSPKNLTLSELFHPILDPLDVPPFYTLHGLQLGGIRIAGVPAEPTTWWGKRLRDSLGDSDTTPVIVAGLVGDYIGYLCTREEYFLQQYEAASMLWGRCFGEWALSLYPPAFAAPTSARRFRVAPFSSNRRTTDCIGRIAPLPAGGAVQGTTLLDVVRNHGWLDIEGAWVPPLGETWRGTRLTAPVVRLWLHREGLPPTPLCVDGQPAGDETGDLAVVVARDDEGRHLRFSASVPWCEDWAGAALSFSVEDAALRPVSVCAPRPLPG